MTVAEVMQILNTHNPLAEVVTHHPGSNKLNKIDSVYTGNEKYMPGEDRTNPMWQYRI